MSSWPILSLVTFLPLVGALFCLVVNGPKEAVDRNCRSAALITSLVTFLVSLLLWVHFDPTKAGFQFEEKLAWVPALNIGYHMGIDGISLFFVLLSTLLTPICILASWEAVQVRVKEYMVAFLVLETFMVGMFCALDLALFYVFFEGVLIPMFLIIGVWGGKRRVYAAFKFFLYTLLGSVLMLLAIIAIYWQIGTTDLPTALEKLQLAVPVAVLAVARLLRLLRGQGADVAGPYLAARRPRRGADGGLGDPGRRAAEDGRLRLHPLLGAAVPRGDAVFRAADLRPVGAWR